jgi:hypothetical protein
MASHAHEKGEKRLVFIDALRVAAIVFVIIRADDLFRPGAQLFTRSVVETGPGRREPVEAN